MSIDLNGPGVTIAEVVAVARQAAPVALTDDANERMKAARQIVETLAEGEPTYGVSTGFGSLATVTIPPERRASLQESLVRSHAAGMGPNVETEVVRAMVFLRARTLAMGHSGTRPVVAQSLLDLINHGIHPLVPEHGSLGASGDLAPLAHGALALLGEGDVEVGGVVQPASQALAAAGLEPLTLSDKEGLALINGTDAILGMLCLAVHDAGVLLTTADVTAALTVEGALATDRAFATEVMSLRPHPGQTTSAANLRALLANPPLVASHRHDDL